MKFDAITFTYNGDKIEAEANPGALIESAVNEASRLARRLNMVVILIHNADRIVIGPRAKKGNVMERWSRKHP